MQQRGIKISGHDSKIINFVVDAIIQHWTDKRTQANHHYKRVNIEWKVNENKLSFNMVK